MTITNTEKTRRTPVTLVQDLDVAKETNALLVDVTREKDTPQAVLLNLHLGLEAALGGVARPARGFLEGTLKPATLRAQGVEGWKHEVRQWHQHQVRAIEASGEDPAKRLAFVQQFGLEHTPILNNRHDKRAWRRISRDL